MTINFYQNDSEQIKVEKTLSHEWTITGTLRDNCDLLNPVVMIEMPPNSTFIWNYMYIPEFSRYYYIADVEIVNNHLVRVQGRVDVLMTFKTFIKEQTAIIQRQENNWNLLLDDGFFRVQNNPKFQLKSFPKGFAAPENYTWVLITAAG